MSEQEVSRGRDTFRAAVLILAIAVGSVHPQKEWAIWVKSLVASAGIVLFIHSLRSELRELRKSDAN